MIAISRLNIVLGSLLLAGCQSIPLFPVAEKPPANPSMLQPLVEKRETITATGYAVISIQNHKILHNNGCWPSAPPSSTHTAR